MKLREISERKRDLDFDQSFRNPLFLQMNVAVKEVQKFFSSFPKNGLDICDFGCGSKPYQVFAGENNYIGIDIDKKNTDADIFSDIENVPVRDASTDIVCSFYVLEHVYNPIEVLREKFRILKAGGALFMLVPLYWEEHEQPYDFWRYTKYALNSMLKEAGFKEIEIKVINGGWAILGIHLVRIMGSRRYTKPLVPFFNYIFYKLDQRILGKARASGGEISDVMSYAVFARK
jgi:SAM-dependent methyltransferase